MIPQRHSVAGSEGTGLGLTMRSLEGCAEELQGGGGETGSLGEEGLGGTGGMEIDLYVG